MKSACHFYAQWRRVALLLFLLAGTLASRAQVPAWQQAICSTQNYGAAGASVKAMATDASGNVYLTGAFAGDVTFGTITLPNPQPGVYDIFVAKWEKATNRFAWVVKAGGAGYDFANAIAVVGSSIYIAGGLSLTPAAFGGFSTTGDGKAYVAKLTDGATAPTFNWVVNAGSSGLGYDEVRGLAVSGPDVYVAGTMGSPTATFGNTVLVNAASNSADIFVAHLTDTGTSASYTWAQRVGGTGTDAANALVLSGSSLYLAGSYKSPSVGFGTATLTNASAGSYADAFVAKLTVTAAGASFVWAQPAGGSYDDAALALAVSGSSVYATGSYAGTTVSFGSLPVASSGSSRAFVAKLTDAGSTGSFEWVQPMGNLNSSSTDQATTVTVSGTDVYVAGSYSGTSGLFGSTSLPNTNSANTDIFVAKLADDGGTGRFVWAQRAGGSNFDYAWATALVGNVLYVTGSVVPPATFGAYSLTSPAATTSTYLAALPTVAVLATATPARLANLSLVPNPARGQVRVQLPPATGAATLHLLDALGRPVRTAQFITSSDCVLDVASLVPGVYVLRVQAGEEAATRRLVVE